MSDDPVEMVRRFLEAFNARQTETMLEMLHPEAELYPMRAQLEGRAYRGHHGLHEVLADIFEDWEEISMKTEQTLEADDAVVALGRLRGRGRVSGVDVDVPMGWVWRLRDGRVVYGRAYSDPRDARRAAGLE